MGTRRHYVTIAIMLSVFVLYGCATTRDDLTQSQSYSIQGCLAGGLGAGTLAYLKYIGDPEQEEKTAIAMAIGCMGGAVIGYEVSKRTQQYTNAQQAAQAETARNKQHTQELHLVNQRLLENIEEYTKQIQNIEDSTFSSKEKREQKQAVQKHVSEQLSLSKASLVAVEQELDESNQKYQSFESTASFQDREAWQTEIASLENEKDILSGHVSTLNALDLSI